MKWPHWVTCDWGEWTGPVPGTFILNGAQIGVCKADARFCRNPGCRKKQLRNVGGLNKQLRNIEAEK